MKNGIIKRRRAILAILAPLTLMVAAWIASALPSDRDIASYQQLLTTSGKVAPKQRAPHIAEQQRAAVQRELLIGPIEERGQLLMSSAASVLELHNDGNGTEVIEQMEQIDAYLKHDSSAIQELHAETGSYNYSRQLLNAQNMALLLDSTVSEGLESIHAGAANYDGSTLLLNDGVTVSAAAGRMEAGQAELNSNAPWQYDTLTLSEEVTLTLDDTSVLTCDTAYLSKEQQRASFSGKNAVIYKSGDTPAWILKSDRMEAQLNPDWSTGVASIVAEGGVVITYNYDIVATGSHGHYQRSDGSIFTLNGDSSSACVVTNGRGDSITAEQLVIDCGSGQLFFIQSSGTIAQGDDTIPLMFEGERLIVDEKMKSLTFEGASQLTHEKLGSLSNQNRLILTGSNGALDTLESWGTTQIAYLDGDLFCDGTLLVNCIEGTAHLHKGAEQVHYRDAIGDLYADDVTIDYQQCEERLTPHQLRLSGHVRMINRISEAGRQYALADNAKFDPKTQHVSLTMDEKGDRILFVDRSHHITISAEAVELRRNGSHKEIRGIGHTRFRFFEEELNAIKTRFKCLNLGCSPCLNIPSKSTS